MRIEIVRERQRKLGKGPSGINLRTAFGRIFGLTGFSNLRHCTREWSTVRPKGTSPLENAVADAMGQR
jgi:hypothetical protein